MSDLYEPDVVEWSEHQAALLRRLATGERVNDQVDWANVIEEIAAVGRSERTGLRGQVGNILQHIMKLEASPARDPRPGWKVSIIKARDAVARTLRDNPSLRPEASGIVTSEMESARKTVRLTLAAYGEMPRVPLEGLDYTADQVTGDWLPPDPPSA